MAAESQIEVAEDRPPSRRLARIAVWIVGVAALIWILDLLGIPVREWIDELFDKLGEIPPGTIVAAVILQSTQTAMTALAWFGILRAMPPGQQVRYRVVLASYATAVALNGFLPANIGTWVMLVMFTVLFAGATFPMMLSGLVVQKSPSASSRWRSTSTSSSRWPAPSRSSSASSPTTPG